MRFGRIIFVVTGLLVSAAAFSDPRTTNDGVYSKAQAKQIVNNFFNSHTPEPQGFSILHQGGKEGAKYVIGNLITNNGSFRVYFLLKKNNGKEYIHQLRIEKK